MELRPELVPAPIPEARRNAVRERIRRIEAALDAGEPAEALVREFNAFTGRDYREDVFHNYWR